MTSCNVIHSVSCVLGIGQK